MAGDWIKMRSNLWDDPRVARLCDLTDSSEAAVIGGLYWLWSTADQHSEDGCMPGLTPRSIDRKTGIRGFAAALIEIDWLEDDPQGVVLKRFEEHNGASAKKRAVTAKRVAGHRSNADVTQAALQNEQGSVTGALARGREEEEKEEEKEQNPEEEQQQASTVVAAGDAQHGSSPVSRSVEIATYLRQRGVAGANSFNPNVAAWGDDVRVTNEILDAALSKARASLGSKAVGPNYLATIIPDLLNPKPTAAPKPKADDWYRSDAGISRKASELGISPRAGETYVNLRERVDAELRRRAQGVAA